MAATYCSRRTSCHCGAIRGSVVAASGYMGAMPASLMQVHEAILVSASYDLYL